MAERSTNWQKNWNSACLTRFVIELVGWVSSLILLATVATQVRNQWRERTARGVSNWLFVGQSVASMGFVFYSVGVKNWVFIATNSLLLLAAILGGIITFRFRNC